MRCDSGIASIYDDSGVEIENAELLLTEEGDTPIFDHYISCTCVHFNFLSLPGAYLFKAYSNGHPYDTSQVWIALFTALLKENPSPAPLMPAIVIPGGLPNQRTWEALRRYLTLYYLMHYYCACSCQHGMHLYMHVHVTTVIYMYIINYMHVHVTCWLDMVWVETSCLRTDHKDNTDQRGRGIKIYSPGGPVQVYVPSCMCTYIVKTLLGYGETKGGDVSSDLSSSC